MTKRPVLVDTQLLVLLTVGATDPRLIERHKRTSGTYRRADFDLLLDLLGYDPRIVFCPHVAAETSNLVGKYGEPDRSRMMSVLKALLNNSTEIGTECRTAMDEPDFLPLGLADAVQLVLCLRGAVLLTDDEPLFNAVAARGGSAIYFGEEKLRKDRGLDA